MRNLMFLGLMLGSCTGPAGPPGPSGPPGADGSDGKDGQSCRAYDTSTGHVFTCDDGYGVTIHDGSSTKISESFFCEGLLEGTGFSASYDAVLFSSKDLWTSGTISGSDLQVSSSAFWSPTQNGYTTASVPGLVADIVGDNNGGYFMLSLDRQTLVLHAVYTDVDQLEPLTWTKDPSSCVHNFY
jgi:hypothetical protein